MITMNIYNFVFSPSKNAFFLVQKKTYAFFAPKYINERVNYTPLPSYVKIYIPLPSYSKHIRKFFIPLP